jgi:hypothetical protein
VNGGTLDQKHVRALAEAAGIRVPDDDLEPLALALAERAEFIRPLLDACVDDEPPFLVPPRTP